MVTENRPTDIKKAVTLLAADFALSQNPNSRKGGLIGLAACAIGLGSQVFKSYIGILSFAITGVFLK